MKYIKAQGEHAALSLVIAFAAGCASAPDSASSQAGAVTSAEMQQKITAAEVEYRGCLAAAARFAVKANYSEARLPLVITPMCYPQFAELDAMRSEGQAGEARRGLVRSADQRQIEYAREAIDQERGSAKVASSR